MTRRGHVVFTLTFVESDEVVTVDDKQMWQNSIALLSSLQKQDPLYFKSTETIYVNPPPTRLNPKAVKFLFEHLDLQVFNRDDPDFAKESDEMLRDVAQAAMVFGCKRFERHLATKIATFHYCPIDLK